MAGSPSRSPIKRPGSQIARRATKGLPGQEYTVYAAEKNRDYEKDQEAAVLTLNEDGKAVSGDLIHGKYYVKETKAPAGYLLDGNKYPVTVSDTAKEIKVSSGGECGPGHPRCN